MGLLKPRPDEVAYVGLYENFSRSYLEKLRIGVYQPTDIRRDMLLCALFNVLGIAVSGACLYTSLMLGRQGAALRVPQVQGAGFVARGHWRLPLYECHVWRLLSAASPPFAALGIVTSIVLPSTAAP